MNTLPAATPLLSVQGLTVLSPAGRRLIDNVSFAIQAGQVLALVGESGSGKTLAGRTVLRLLPPQLKQVSGTLTFAGQDLASLPESEIRKLRGSAMGMVFQEPMVSLNPAMRIGEQLCEGLLLHEALSRAEAHERAVAMLRRVRIADPEACMKSFPHQFSGGMRQRIMLASVMLVKPRLLIADEPTTALDSLSQREVMEIMAELTRTEGTAVLLITHDLGLVARYADTVVVLEKGHHVESGPARQVLTDPAKPYTRSLIDALPQRRDKYRTQTHGEPLIEARALTVSFPGTSSWRSKASPKRALNGVSLAVQPGEVVAIVGGSGSGKTTLGRAMLGLLPIESGELRYRGQPVPRHGAAAARAFRLDCQLVFQDPYSSLNPRRRIGDAVGEPLLHVAGLSREQRHQRVGAMLAEVGLAGFEDRYPHALSGGQRQRVAIARALIGEPGFVVADEPVSALDMSIQKQVLQLLKTMQAQRRFACMFISHNMAVVSEIADRIVVMDGGQIIEEGSVADIFDRPQQAYTRSLLEAATTSDLLAELGNGREALPALPV
ncbi:MAG TPA: ABC transporter ATP-binding protein [Roseateles sp.]|uniref:ABC transporter ATP-binding protein n=1 Tax=Roseateles sp. TaxID=1971397 RepID=UPI002ED9E3DC